MTAVRFDRQRQRQEGAAAASAVRPFERSDSSANASHTRHPSARYDVSALRSLSPACAPACAAIMRPLRRPSRRRRRSRRISVAWRGGRTRTRRGQRTDTHTAVSACAVHLPHLSEQMSLLGGCCCCFARLAGCDCTADGRRSGWPLNGLSAIRFVWSARPPLVRVPLVAACCCIERQERMKGMISGDSHIDERRTKSVQKGQGMRGASRRSKERRASGRVSKGAAASAFPTHFPAFKAIDRSLRSGWACSCTPP